MAQLATHAGTRLEDDAAAAHAGLTRDADAASAALHAHGEHQATQIVTDADRVADAVVEHVHAIARPTSWPGTLLPTRAARDSQASGGGGRSSPSS
jgi:hypothetical protein